MWDSSYLSTLNQPPSLASFSSSILPSPPFVLVLLNCFNNLWLFFLPPGLHSPQSNVSKMQIWPRHFSAWILSTVTIYFKFSLGLEGLPWPLLTSGLSLTHTCAATKCFQFFKHILMVYTLCDVFFIPSVSTSFFAWLTFIHIQSSCRYCQ